MHKYQILKKIGCGSQATAYLVENTTDSRIYVLKQIFTHELSKSEQAEAFAETRVLSTLHHPNIIAFRDSFMHEESCCLVIEYASKGDLAQVIANATAPLAEDQIIHYFCGTVLALQYCHSRKVLHRDLKLENIFISEDNTVKLGDFGISRILRNTYEMVSTVVGTPCNLSPELVDNQPYDAKSDIWALGCALYELCTFNKPFSAKSMLELVLKISDPHPITLPTTYNSEIQQLVDQMLQIEPKLRPSATEILAVPLIRKYYQLSTKRDTIAYNTQNVTELSKWLKEKREEIDRLQRLAKGIDNAHTKVSEEKQLPKVRDCGHIQRKKKTTSSTDAAIIINCIYRYKERNS